MWATLPAARCDSDGSDCVYLISSQVDHITEYSRSVTEHSDGFKKLSVPFEDVLTTGRD